MAKKGFCINPMMTWEVFSRSFLSFNDIVTEDIADGTGQFTMTRRFTKMDGEWYLIYYKEMGRK
jgi:hypothetical protein